jgi:hypothetical protein
VRIAAEMVGSLFAGLGFGVAPERFSLRALLPLRRGRTNSHQGIPEAIGGVWQSKRTARQNETGR